MLGVEMNMPPDEASVEMTPGVDPHQFTLTPQEVFMMTRALLGRQKVGELIGRTGFPADQARALLQTLVSKGVLQLHDMPHQEAPPALTPQATEVPRANSMTSPTDVMESPKAAPAAIDFATSRSPTSFAAPSAPPVSASVSPPKPTVASPVPQSGTQVEIGESEDEIPYAQAHLAEVCDLTIAQKKRILRAQWLFENRCAHAVLGVRLEADASTIKKSYFKVSRDFHPDAYFRKELGSYKERTEQVFRLLKEAYAVLSDPARRAEYERKLAPTQVCEADRPILEARLAAQLKAVGEAERARERDAKVAATLKKKRLAANPMLQRVKQARDWVQAAEDAAAAGNAAEAVRLAHLAREYAPQDDKVTLRARKIIQVHQLRSARELMHRAQSEAEAGQIPESMASADQALQLAPKNAILNFEACKIYRAGGQAPKAIRVAQVATENSPYEADYWLILAELAEGASQWELAIQAAERLLELRPNARDSNVRLKRVRKAAQKSGLE